MQRKCQFADTNHECRAQNAQQATCATKRKASYGSHSFPYRLYMLCGSSRSLDARLRHFDRGSSVLFRIYNIQTATHCTDSSDGGPRKTNPAPLTRSQGPAHPMLLPGCSGLPEPPSEPWRLPAPASSKMRAIQRDIKDIDPLLFAASPAMARAAYAAFRPISNRTANPARSPSSTSASRLNRPIRPRNRSFNLG